MKDKLLKKIKTGLLVLALILAIISVFFIPQVRDFLAEIENKTFDVRQSILANYKKPNQDIVILAIDDASYEHIISEYGAWPMPRDFWAHIAEKIEKQNPKAIVFDLLFVQNFKAYGNSDSALVNTVKSNDNIYLSMNFDNQNPEVRKPINLPSTLETNITGNRKFLENAEDVKYTNVRPLLNGILYGTKNIGFINVPRNMDGVTRNYYPLFNYKNKFYKHLTFKVGLDLLHLDDKNIEIKGKNIILSNGKKIPLDEKGMATLNWYGGAMTYNYVPLWEVDKAIKNKDGAFLKNTFKNKIVYIGTSATSLSDIKSTPLSKRVPGVETHATFLNNILDDNFINKTGPYIDLIIAFILVILTGLVIVRSKSVPKAAGLSVGIIALYTLLTIFVMYFFNIWIGIVLPVTMVILTITVSYAVKYIITSRDYEHTYKLAVTDGLTDMYNHRYFQEQMKLNIEHSKRYGSPFSLIMVDIDFFKKFNDKYGHQSGDAVLRQVAQTIKKNIRSTDIPCRYGGEEMSVILTNTKKEEAIVVAQKICEAVRIKEFELATGDWAHVTISVGVAVMPDNSETTEGLIEYADKCLYIAKENGRNQVVSSI